MKAWSAKVKTLWTSTRLGGSVQKLGPYVRQDFDLGILEKAERLTFVAS